MLKRWMAVDSICRISSPAMALVVPARSVRRLTPDAGTAADIIKRAMIAVDEWLRSEKPRVRMIMQVHDELVFEVHKDELDAVSKRSTN